MTRLPRHAVLWVAVALSAAAVAASGPEPAPASAPPAAPPAAYPLSSYAAIGSSFAQSSHLSELGWDDAQIAAFLDGVRAGILGKPYPLDAEAQKMTNDIALRLQEIDARERQRAFAQPEHLKQYLKEACKRLHLEQTDSGLCYAIRFGSKGIRPGPDDTVVVSCAATAADGATPLPQLSSERARVKLKDTLPGFIEGFQMMTVGSEAVFVLPPALSFGDGNWPPGVDRGSPLIFRITLSEVISAGAPH